MRRKVIAAMLLVPLAVVGTLAVTGGLSSKPLAEAAESGKNNAQANGNSISLPVSSVILFSSGVGYFEREGQVEGNAKVELSFPVGNINDLLKSMVLQDLNGGKVSTVNYDSHDPIEKTLRSFAVNLHGNPSFGQLLNQTRGEKVEVVLQQSHHTQAGTFNGTVVGVEHRKEAISKDAVADVEYLNVMTAEGLRSVRLADVQRVRFASPVMEKEFTRALEVLARSHDTQKKTVTLSFTGDGKRKVRVGYVVENPIWKTSYRLVLDKKARPFLQGWAVVENPSDEDWKDVRMSLVSGRPISFQMDLYQPLYLRRPVVEPELFASLRPPTYSGAMTEDLRAAEKAQGGRRAHKEMETDRAGYAIPNESKKDRKPGSSRPAPPALSPAPTKPERLELQQGVASAATAAALGDFFQYSIDQPVTLPRQKSAMIPIVNKDVDGSRVSIYNELTLAKHPLLGLKFKNTTGLHLMQGPITIFEGSSYAGDARIMDLQPNEDRLISYAIDLGTEVEPVYKREPDRLLSVKIDKGILTAINKLRETKTFNVKNRSEHDRVLLIEHPFRPDFKLIKPEKPAEKARDVYRFELKVAAGKTASLPVIEERDIVSHIALTDYPTDSVRFYLSSNVTSEKVREALKKALALKDEVEKTRREHTQVNLDLNRITQEQARLRANLERVPVNSDLAKRYLEKLGNQETEIEKLQAQLKKLEDTLQEKNSAYRNYVSNLSVE